MRKSILLILCLISLSVNAANKHYAIKGKLGTDISFRLDLEEEEYTGLVAGETTYYRKNGKISKIKVYGRGYDVEYDGNDLHSMLLSEYNGTKLCGNFYLLFEDDGDFESGTWSLGDKGYEMNEVVGLPATASFLRPVDMTDATGVYEFAYDCGNEYMPERGGTLQLYANRRNIAYTICQTTPNIAETQGTTSEFFQNVFYLRVANAAYTVNTFDGVVFVKRDNPGIGPCSEFGANADIEGVYIATGKEPSGSILDAFQSEEAFGRDFPCSLFILNEAWEDAVQGETTFPDLATLKDIDGDGKSEIIARYIADRTDRYEVSGNRAAVFTVSNGKLTPVAIAVGELEQLEVADGYVIKSVRNSRGTRKTYTFYKLVDGCVVMQAAMTEAEINNYTINGSTVSEKEFKKKVKVKNRTKVEELKDIQELPGNDKRNENAARG